MKITVILMTFFIPVILHAQEVNDTVAIKKLLEKESATWRSGDNKGHSECWHVQPYSKILVSLPNGKCYDISAENIIRAASGQMGNGGYAVNSNYGFSIHQNDAWVSHDEKSYAKDGTITYSHEIKILEKINNEWKMVAQSIHIYVP
jgi:hypothetical protein